MAPFLTFTDLTRKDIEDLLPLAKAQRKKFLREKLSIDRMSGFEVEVVLDFHFQNFEWAVQKKMEHDKISTFVSIMKSVLGEIYAQRLSMEDSFESFKQFLLIHSVHRPPYSIGIFNADEVRDIKDYILDTLYRHFKLYQFIFVTHRELQVHINKKSVLPASCDSMDELTDEFEVNPRDQIELASLFTPPAKTRSPPPYDNAYGNSDVPPQLLEGFEAKVNDRLRKMEEKIDTRLDSLKA